MHHSHLHQTFPHGKAPDRAIKRALHDSRREHMNGAHHSEVDEPKYSTKLGPKQAKAWQALKHTAVKRSRAAKSDEFGLPLDGTEPQA